MAERLCCYQGHRWEPTFPLEAWPPDFRSSCPVCGEKPIGPADMSITTMRVLCIIAVICIVVGPVLLFVAPEMIFIGVGLLIVAVVIAIAGIATWSGRQRTKEMASVADAMSFAFMPHILLAGLHAMARFRLFTLGRSQKAYNVMQGRVGDCDVLFFEYHYTVGSGKSSHTYQVSAVILPDGASGLPDFNLAPKTFFDKLAAFFTHGSIEFEDAPEFTSRCKLSGSNPEALRETFHPDLVHYLGRDGKWFIEAVDGQLLLYQQKRLNPDQCPGLVADALEIRDLLRGVERRTA